ncbi:MAG: PDZ domain-containing protein [Armatimonadetes bacterium]|nr:PDZ domain-containing protein [Armatimonadota bacterium]
MAALLALAAFAAFQGTSAPIEVPFRIGSDAIIVDATVNGRKLSLMFDTGFGGAIVHSAGINLGKATGKMTLRDFVGEFEAETTDIKSFRLGSVEIDPKGMVAVKDNAEGDYSQSYNTHCDGILGFQALTKYVLEINMEKSRFVLHPKSFDFTTRVPDNKRTFLAKLLPTGHNAMEMEVSTSDGKKMTMALDTGNAFYATTHRDVLERIGAWQVGAKPKFMKASFVASGEVASWSKRLKNMVVFGVPVPDGCWDIIDAPSGSAESDGTIGFGFLKNFNVLVDYERRRVWLENFNGKVGSEDPGEIGIYAANDPNTKRAIVVFVAPESPAARAGIKVRDAILSIDGIDELNVGHRALQKLLEGAVGSTVKLVLSRNGNLMRLDLKRELLVND